MNLEINYVHLQYQLFSFFFNKAKQTKYILLLDFHAHVLVGG